MPPSSVMPIFRAAFFRIRRLCNWATDYHVINTYSYRLFRCHDPPLVTGFTALWANTWGNEREVFATNLLQTHRFMSRAHHAIKPQSQVSFANRSACSAGLIVIPISRRSSPSMLVSTVTAISKGLVHHKATRLLSPPTSCGHRHWHEH